MTFGHLAIAATAALVVGSLWGFLASGSLLVGMGVLAAPIPCLIVYGLLSDRSDWTWREWQGRRARSPPEVAAALHRALRDEAPLLTEADQDALFLPDCPALPETRSP